MIEFHLSAVRPTPAIHSQPINFHAKIYTLLTSASFASRVRWLFYVRWIGSVATLTAYRQTSIVAPLASVPDGQ